VPALGRRSIEMIGRLPLGLAVPVIALAACSGGGDGSEPVAPARGESSSEPPTALFVLGDSLSDVGNAAALADWLLDEPFVPRHTVGLCNPADVYVYQRGCDELFFERSRVSDGPVAVEHLAAHLDVPLGASYHTVPERPEAGTDYAVATGKAAGEEPADLARQVDMLVLDHGPLLPETALYVVMIGGNDAIDALQAAAGAADPEAAAAASAAVIAAAVDAVDTNLRRLIAFGARRLIVGNVPDLAALPVVRERAAAMADVETALATAAAVSSAFNSALDARLAAIAAESPETTLIRFDLYSAVRGAAAAAAATGDNVVDACFDAEAYHAAPTAERTFHPDCSPDRGGEIGFERFFFWDGLHPTGAAHAALGQALIGTYVASQPVLNLARR